MPLAKKNVYKKSFIHIAVSILNAELLYVLSDEACARVCAHVCVHMCMLAFADAHAVLPTEIF